MCNAGLIYRRLPGLLIIPVLLINCYDISAQKKTKNLTRLKSDPDTITDQIGTRDSLFLNPADTIGNMDLIPPRVATDKFVVMMDSLRVRTSKNLMAQKIFNLFIVSKAPVNSRQISGKSEFGFLMHSGKTIRSIEIIRLNVFGTNINAPLYNEPGKLQSILNKTHLNTNEAIIRRSLLFEEGDKISALTLSDNERLLRNLPFIDDARIIVLPISEKDVDIVVITKDVYSIGGNISFRGIKAGRISVFDKNLLGMGHELEFKVPYDARATNNPGFGIDYTINNIRESFIKLRLSYYDGFNYNTILSEKSYGITLSRDLVSATTKYAGGISVNHMSTFDDLKTLAIPEPVKYNLQDYWVARSYLINKESVTRFIIGLRYKNNNVFDRPFIHPYSYYNLQKYKILLGSLSLSTQKFYKTNLIYSHGRTEDIPYGGMLRLTAGREINEFSKRSYYGADAAIGRSSQSLGYFYGRAGLASFFDGSKSEQGVVNMSLNYFSNLWPIRDFMIRNFLNVNYTRGFNRYVDEGITVIRDNGFSGFRNDSIKGGQRISISLETVYFSPSNFYGFRLAFFTFADVSFLTPRKMYNETANLLSGFGIGLRIRNDNLLINIFQVRLGFYPNLPAYSRISNLSFSGEQLLSPATFDPGPPSIIPYE